MHPGGHVVGRTEKEPLWPLCHPSPLPGQRRIRKDQFKPRAGIWTCHLFQEPVMYGWPFRLPPCVLILLPAWKRNGIDSAGESKRRSSHFCQSPDTTAPLASSYRDIHRVKNTSFKIWHKYVLLPLLILDRYQSAVLKFLKELHGAFFLRKQPLHHHAHNPRLIIIFRGRFN